MTQNSYLGLALEQASHFPSLSGDTVWSCALSPFSPLITCIFVEVYTCVFLVVFLDFPGGSDGKASAYNAGDLGSIPGSGRSPGEGNGNPLQCSCLENPTYREAWQATVHGVAESDTTEDFTFTFTLCQPNDASSYSPAPTSILLVLRNMIASF